MMMSLGDCQPAQQCTDRVVSSFVQRQRGSSPMIQQVLRSRLNFSCFQFHPNLSSSLKTCEKDYNVDYYFYFFLFATIIMKISSQSYFVGEKKKLHKNINSNKI
jgi:hypothetical protein